MNKISQNINPQSLPSIKLKVYWAMDCLETKTGNRFSTKQITDFLVEKKDIDVSRQAVCAVLKASKGAVNKNKDGYKLMDTGRNELGKAYSSKPPKSFSEVPINNHYPLYKLHSKIEKVSIVPFKSNLYKEAVQNALVEVINEVKVKTGNPKDSQGKDLDGDKLMQYVFGCDNQTPVIAFNTLSNSLDSAEQRGLMNLFKGIVGIRDRKAHLNFVQKDPKRAFEYLVLASLLLNLVDEYKN